MKSLSCLNRSVVAAIIIVAMFAACKKNKKPTPDTEQSGGNTMQTETTNRTELTNDSLFLYAKQIYYWNTSLPAYDTYLPRQYRTSGSDLENYETNLFNIVKSSNSPDYVIGDAYPKYSYIEDITERNPNAVVAIPDAKLAVDLEGNGNDVGIMWIPYRVTSPSQKYILFISVVYPGSDAESKGVRRGWSISKINGKSFGTNTYDAGEYSSIVTELAKGSVTIEGVKYLNGVQGESYSMNLTKTNYKSSPVYASKVISSGTKKIGYIAYGRFSNESNSFSVLNAAFNDFASQNVTDLVVDLRYNGGGYVNTAEHLVNLIAPASASGVMYKEYFNSDMQNKKATILQHQPFTNANDEIQYKTVDGRRVMKNLYDDADYSVSGNTYSFSKFGNLTGVSNIIFLVSGNTASASELVINSLKPKMNVKLVGRTTYGKPVGFFPIRLQNRYDVLYAMFETKNSLDQGGYFSGMSVDYSVDENPTYALGDISEAYLAKAISVLTSNQSTSSLSNRSVMTIGGKQVSLDSQSALIAIGETAGFKGMIEDRRTPRK